MMKEWATVVSWQQGVATLQCEQKSSCNSCRSRQTCGSGILNQLGRSHGFQLKVASEQPLVAGQRVEIGLAEKSLLLSALLVYITPLLGLMLGGSLLQWLVADDIITIAGSCAGGVMGALIAKYGAVHFAKNSAYHPVILRVALLSTRQE